MLIDTVVGNSIHNKSYMPAVPPRNNNQITLDAFKSGGQKMDELLLNSDSDSDFDPRAEENDSSSGSGINGNINGNKHSNDFFGFEPQQYSFSANTSVNRVNGVNGNSTNASNAPPNIPPPLCEYNISFLQFCNLYLLYYLVCGLKFNCYQTVNFTLPFSLLLFYCL